MSSAGGDAAGGDRITTSLADRLDGSCHWGLIKPGADCPEGDRVLVGSIAVDRDGFIYVSDRIAFQKFAP